MEVLTVKDVLWAGPERGADNQQFNVLKRAHIVRLSDYRILVFGAEPKDVLDGFRALREKRMERAHFYRGEVRAFEAAAAEIDALIQSIEGEDAPKKPFTRCPCCALDVVLATAVICKACGKAVHQECQGEDDQCTRCGGENETD